VKANARALGARLMSYGYKLVTDGTDNHLVLWDLRKEVRIRQRKCSCLVPGRLRVGMSVQPQCIRRT
jgi:glycine/serine hydroxymethyltransferase